MKTEGSVFYISTAGCSAGEWLAKMLSRHSQVVCFRASRTFPPYLPQAYQQEISVDDYMEGLLECGRATFGEKVFGSMHGYHGLLAKEACETRGGRFSYVIRHPISRIHSAFTMSLEEYYYKKFNIPVQNKDIHGRICSDILASADLMKYETVPQSKINRTYTWIKKSMKQSAKHVFSDTFVRSVVELKCSSQRRLVGLKAEAVPVVVPNEKDYAASAFGRNVKEFLGHDQELFEGCSTKCAIKMEEMVKSPEYFKDHVWPLVAPEFEATDPYLRSIFSEKRFNAHRDKPLSPKEIWESWPQGMKDFFMKYFELYKISSVCKAFDYDVSFL